MKVFSWGEWPDCAASALTIGTFDGPHLGHVAIFDALLRHRELTPGVVTFAKPPAARFSPCPLIVPLEKRLDFFEKKGFNFALVIDFSENFAKIEGVDFLRLLKEKSCLRFLAEGENFKMGAGGLCGAKQIATLAAPLGFTFEVVPPVLFQGERISSSRIRSALGAGKTDLAEAMLGRSIDPV